MKSLALVSIVVFAAAAGLGEVCALRCAEAPVRAAAPAHCADMPAAPEIPQKGHPCGHGHCGEALVSVQTNHRVLTPAMFDARSAALAAPVALPLLSASVRAAESPPSRSSLLVLRL